MEIIETIEPSTQFSICVSILHTCFSCKIIIKSTCINAH